MKKTIMLAISFILIACICTNVLANDEIPSLNPSLNLNKVENPTGGNTQTPSNTVENTTGNSLGNTIGNSLENTAGNSLSNSATNNNSSSYQESDTPLSNAGVESSVLMVSAFVVCAVIGIYTFMKLSDYSNI